MIIPPLPRDVGTARTAIQVYAVNLIANRLGEMLMAQLSYFVIDDVMVVIGWLK